MKTPFMATAIVLMAASFASASPIVTRQQALSDCLSPYSPVTPSSSSYSSLTAAYNQRIQPEPSSYLTPDSSETISRIVTCAKDAGVNVTALSGGHSYASRGLDGQIVISLSKFKNIELSEDGSIVKIGAGQRLGDVALALNQSGKALPHGTCPWVGIGGHASFGGYGFPSRMWGLTLDTIAAFDVVMADGTIKTNLTREQDSDLYWALAGAAPSFGIITSFYFRTYSTPSSAVNFEYSYPASNLSVDQASELFAKYQTFGLSSAPKELGVMLVAGPGGTLNLHGTYFGTQCQFEEVFAPMKAGLPEGYEEKVKQMTWIESLEDVAGGQKLNTSLDKFNRDTFQAKSLTTPESMPMNANAINSLFSYLWNTKTDSNWFLEANLYGGNNSAINAVSPNTNSFGHRRSLFVFQLYGSSPTYGLPYPEENLEFVQGMYDSIVNPMKEIWGTEYGAYVNYVDPTLSVEEGHKLYYDTQYSRLKGLKNTYDPSGVFRNNDLI